MVAIMALIGAALALGGQDGSGGNGGQGTTTGTTTGTTNTTTGRTTGRTTDRTTGATTGTSTTGTTEPTVTYYDDTADYDQYGFGDPQAYVPGTQPDDWVRQGGDNCPYDYNPDQADTDYDGEGDVCDASIEGTLQDPY